MIPVGGLLILRVPLDYDILARGFGVEVRLEGIFGYPSLEAGAGPGGALEESGLVVTGPGVASRSRLTDVAREHQGQICRAVVKGGVEPVVDPFTDVDRHRLDRRDVLGQALD